jgi:hypothetical protein
MVLWLSLGSILAQKLGQKDETFDQSKPQIQNPTQHGPHGPDNPLKTSLHFL